MKRRDFLRALGMLAAAATVTPAALVERKKPVPPPADEMVSVLVKVEPMTRKHSQIFYLDYEVGDTILIPPGEWELVRAG